MKKYLFLLFLFIVYVFLMIRNYSVPAVSYENRYDDNILNITINFENGINSKSLKTMFDDYKKDYYIYSMKIKNDDVKLSCAYINDCLNEIYKEEDNIFNIMYGASGFKIDSVNLLAYKNEIENFLNMNNLSYKLNKR